MKKKVLAFSCFVFLVLASPSRAVDFPQEEIVEQEDSLIFSDPSYQKPTHNFSPGQTVYIKVEATGRGEQERILRLLDSEKKEVKRLILNRNGNGPYLFTTSFAAPSDPGIYYVDIKIKDEGFSFASQENINVSKGCASRSVSSEAESVTPIPTSAPTPDLAPERLPALGFVSRIMDFVRKLLSNLTGLFK